VVVVCRFYVGLGVPVLGVIVEGACAEVWGCVGGDPYSIESCFTCGVSLWLCVGQGWLSGTGWGIEVGLEVGVCV
jgi:hypothetical protein